MSHPCHHDHAKGLKVHVKLEDNLVDLDSRSRRENVRIYGVLEGSENDSTTMVLFVVSS